jgi:hypothetical protein
MKTLSLSLLTFIVTLFCFVSPTALAAPTVKIAWDAPPAESSAPTGYRLYRKVVNAAGAVTWTLAAQYDLAAVIEPRMLDITLVGGGTYTLTAYNLFGESDRSAEVVVPGKPGVLLNVRVIVTTTQ